MSNFFLRLAGSTLAELPKAPDNLVTSAIENRELMLSWRNNNEGIGDSNVIQQWSPSTLRWITLASTSLSGTTYNVEDLLPNTAYKLRVAVLFNGDYFPSLTTEFSTSDKNEPIPYNINVTDIAWNAVTVNWENEVIEGMGEYNLVKIFNQSGNLVVEQHEDLTAIQAVVTGLTNGRNYSTMVCVADTVNTPTPSHEFFYCPSIFPDFTTDSLTPTNHQISDQTSSTVTTTWDNNANGKPNTEGLNQYVYWYTAGQGVDTATYELVDFSANQHLFNALPAGVESRIYVMVGTEPNALTAVAFSTVINFTTAAAPMPVNMSLSNEGASEVTLNWSGYDPSWEAVKVQICSDATGWTWIDVATLAPEATEYRFTGLTMGGIPYNLSTCIVVDGNTFCNGWDAYQVFYTKSWSDVVPNNLHVNYVDITATSLVLSYSDRNLHDETYNQYVAISSDNTNWTYTEVAKDSTGFEFTGLTENQLYYLVVMIGSEPNIDTNYAINSMSETPVTPAVIPTNYIAFWDFEDSAIDSVSGYTMATGVDSYSAGVVGNALTTNGQYIANNDFIPALSGTNNFTLSTWAKASNNNNLQLFIFTDILNNYAVTNRISYIDNDNENYLRFTDRQGVDHSYGTIFDRNQWIHWVVSFDGNATMIYSNGVLIDGIVDSTPIVLDSVLLCQKSNSDDSYHDQTRVYNYALTSGEIQALYYEQ